MSESEKIYTIVEFEDGLQMIPTFWMFEENNSQFSWWPSFINQIKINKAIISLTKPDSTWSRHKVVRIFCSAGSYHSGKEKLQLAETMSDIDSSDKETIKRSRHGRHARRISDSDSEDERSSVKRCTRPLPSPPKKLQRFSNVQHALTNPLQHLAEMPSTSSASSDIVDFGGTSTTPKRNFSSTSGGVSNIVDFGGTPATPKRNIPSTSSGLSDIVDFGGTPATPKMNFDQTGIDFCKEILRKINYLIYRVNSLESQIQLGSGGSSSSGSYEDCLDDKFNLPLKSEAELNDVEEKLNADPVFSKKMTNTLKGIGGNDLHGVIINILRKLFTNGLANKFSLQGKKKKRSLKDLQLFQVIMKAVRHHHASTTEEIIGKTVATWLTQTGLRLSRELLKEEQMSKPTTSK